MNQPFPTSWPAKCAHCGAPMEISLPLSEDVFCSSVCRDDLGGPPALSPLEERVADLERRLGAIEARWRLRR
jgi:hypothetical protein